MTNGPPLHEANTASPGLHEVVGQLTGLDDVAILRTSNLAEVVGSMLTSWEYRAGPDRFADLGATQSQYERLRSEGLLPANLQDQAIFARRYMELMRDLPRDLAGAMAGMPDRQADDVIQQLGDLTAPILAELITAPGGHQFERGAGVRVEADTAGRTYTARTLGGMVFQFPRVSGMLTEYGPGLSGGMARMRELERGVWDQVILLEGISFPLEVINHAAGRLGVDASSCVVASDGGMGAGSDMLAEAVAIDEATPWGGRIKRADLVVAAKLRHADTGELREAISRSAGIGRVLLVGDFEATDSREVDIRAMIGWATEVFGEPTERNQAVVQVGRQHRTVHEAVFRRNS